MYEISEDYISNDFIADHLDDISKAADGDAAAIDRLRDALADDIILRIAEDNKIDADEIMKQVNGLRTWIADNSADFEVGMQLDSFSDSSNEFLQMCQKIIDDAHMTADQANEFFRSMGFETTFATEEKPVTKRGHETITETYQSGVSYIPSYHHNQDGSVSVTYDEAPRMVTRTYQGRPYEYTDYVEAVAMSADGTPKIDSITRRAGGSFNNSSARNPGGGGSSKGGGGGGKTSTPKTKSGDRYHEITSKIQQNSAELTKLSTIKDRAFGPDKVDAISAEIDALQVQADLYGELYDEAKRYYDMDKEALASQYGATFNPDGTIANYDAWYQQFIDKYNSGQMDDDA
jgi:hypothetical protein